MKRAPIVIGGTIAGLAGVLAFHTTPAKLAIAGVQTPPSATAPAAGSGPGAGGRRQPASGTGKRSGGLKKHSRAAPRDGSGCRSRGRPVNYNFGVMSVKVTVSGHKILKVGIASMDDGGNPRSEFIDQQAIPILEQEVMQAQNASIQGVSGASYTSAGFSSRCSRPCTLPASDPDARDPAPGAGDGDGRHHRRLYLRERRPGPGGGPPAAAPGCILHRADEVFSTWQPGSAVSRMRRGEIAAADAPPEVADVMAACGRHGRCPAAGSIRGRCPAE